MANMDGCGPQPACAPVAAGATKPHRPCASLSCGSVLQAQRLSLMHDRSPHLNPGPPPPSCSRCPVRPVSADSDAIFTDMDFAFPLEEYALKGQNLVMWGEAKQVDANRVRRC